MSTFLEYDVSMLGLCTPAEGTAQMRVGLHADARQPRMIDVWLSPNGAARCEPPYYEPVMQNGLLTHIREVFYA